MKSILLILSSLITINSFVLSQPISSNQSAQSSVAYPELGIRSWQFPSAIATLDNTTLYISHHLPYGLTPLASTEAGIAWQAWNGAMAFQVQQSGFEGFRYWKGALNMAQKLGNVRSGLRINLHQSNTSYLHQTAFTIDASLFMPLAEYFYIGAFIENIWQQTWSHNEESLPSSLSLGISQQPLKVFAWQVAVQKPLEGKPTVFVGVYYEFKKHFFTRLGYQSQPNKMQWALGFKSKYWRASFSMDRHYLLGLSQQMVFSWEIAPRRNKAERANIQSFSTNFAYH